MALTVLTMRGLGLAGLLTAVPALRGIRRALPAHRHVLATSPWVAQVVPLLGPGLVDAILPVHELGPVPFGGAVDIAVNLHGRGPESHARLLELRPPPRRLVAFAVEGSFEHGPEWRPHENEAQRWCRLVLESGLCRPDDVDPRDLSIDAPVDREPPPGAAGAVVVHPGGTRAARQWPPQRWAELVARLVGDGRRIVLTGSAEEHALCEQVAGLAGVAPAPVEAVSNLAGTGDVADLAAVVAAAAHVVSGDTGIAHLATALGTPSTVLFGPVPPSEWGPPPDTPQHLALWHGPDGLGAITVEEVYLAVRRPVVLGAGQQGGAPQARNAG